MSEKCSFGEASLDKNGPGDGFWWFLMIECALFGIAAGLLLRDMMEVQGSKNSFGVKPVLAPHWLPTATDIRAQPNLIEAIFIRADPGIEFLRQRHEILPYLSCISCISSTLNFTSNSTIYDIKSPLSSNEPAGAGLIFPPWSQHKTNLMIRRERHTSSTHSLGNSADPTDRRFLRSFVAWAALPPP